jgi:hypothetical protein
MMQAGMMQAGIMHLQTSIYLQAVAMHLLLIRVSGCLLWMNKVVSGGVAVETG